MTPELPSFLRRRIRLHEARRSLLGGEPERALRQLEDRSLSLSEEADRLRVRVLDVLCREAARLASEGQESEMQRLLAVVEPRDPERADRWRRRITHENEPSQTIPRSGLSPGGESQILTALEGLLLEMREKRARAAGSAPASAAEPASSASNGTSVSRASSSASRFHLAVDDAGEYLVVSGDALILGHSRGGKADLPFLADLDSRHAVLRRGESFHGGPTWTIEAARDQRIQLDGKPLPPGGAELADGVCVQLSSNVAFRFRAPEPGSGSALLELLHGIECVGALRVLLLAPGRSGRMRFGTRARRHVQLRGADVEVTLELEGAQLFIASEAGLSVSGGQPVSATEARLDCPPLCRVDFVVGHAVGARPPFGFSIRPLEQGS